MTRTALAVLAAGILGFSTTTSGAAACDPGKSAGDMSVEDAQKVYECIAEDLAKGYAKKSDKRWIPWDRFAEYRGWTKASTAPAAPGFHTGRFLVTYVNETGAEAYMKYEDDPTIPAGTLIAKESFAVTDKGTLEKGPLFLMEKVAAGTSPETMDWYYMMVAPNGAPVAVNVMAACNTCHMENFGHQGALGYPVEEVRAAN